MYQRLKAPAQQPPKQVVRVPLEARNVAAALLSLQRSAGNTAVLSLVVQRRQIDVGNGRSVGSTPGAAANTREDVLNVMDRMHVAWHLSNSDHAAEYPVVANQPPGSVVATSRIPLTLAAVDRAEKAESVPAGVAQAILGVTLSGGVGPGEKNARADVLALQHAMRRPRPGIYTSTAHWQLGTRWTSFPPTTRLIPPVSSSPDRPSAGCMTASFVGFQVEARLRRPSLRSLHLVRSPSPHGRPTSGIRAVCRGNSRMRRLHRRHMSGWLRGFGLTAARSRLPKPGTAWTGGR